jgi:hypothetical protein
MGIILLKKRAMHFADKDHTRSVQPFPPRYSDTTSMLPQAGISPITVAAIQ